MMIFDDVLELWTKGSLEGRRHRSVPPPGRTIVVDGEGKKDRSGASSGPYLEDKEQWNECSTDNAQKGYLRLQ